MCSVQAFVIGGVLSANGMNVESIVEIAHDVGIFLLKWRKWSFRIAKFSEPEEMMEIRLTQHVMAILSVVLKKFRDRKT